MSTLVAQHGLEASLGDGTGHPRPLPTPNRAGGPAARQLGRPARPGG